MYVHSLNPTLLHLGPLEIRWYGLVYILGFFLAVWWLQYAWKKEWISLRKEQIWDLMFYVLVGVLLGSRLFMVFWNPEIYLLKPWNLLFIWQGGMSFHGGFIGATVGTWWYCKRFHLNFWKVADLLSVPIILALGLGRIANFINGELWGRVFNGSWCVNFKNTGGGDVCRHPSTLYAAGKRFLIFGWLFWLSLKQKFTPGFIFWNLVFWEGLGRIIVDFYRENALFWGFSLGQWFSLVMVLVALWMFVKKYGDDWKSLLS
jgi:phosphatidylglycerol---prolipoprotein diacylglyceryl transferase